LAKDYLLATLYVPGAGNHDIADIVIAIKHDQIGGSIGDDSSTIPHTQNVCNIARECGQNTGQRTAVVQQIPQRPDQAGWPADIHVQHLSLIVKYRQATTTIGTDCHPVRGGTGIQEFRQCDVSRPCILVFRDGKSRYVDRATGPRQLNGLIEQRSPAIDMGGIKYTCRQLAFGKRAHDQVHSALPATEVQMKYPGFPRNHACDVRIAGNAQEFIEGRLARPVITDCQLAYTDYRIEKHDVIANTASECDWRYVVATRMAPGTEAFFTQCIRLRQQ